MASRVEVAMSMIAPAPAPAEPPDVEPIDLECHSVRDFLHLIATVRQAKPRDPLRALEDVLLDLAGG